MIAIVSDYKKRQEKKRETYTLREVYENKGILKCFFGPNVEKIIKNLGENYVKYSESGKGNQYFYELLNKKSKVLLRITSSKGVLQKVYIRYYGKNKECPEFIEFGRLRARLEFLGLERILSKGYDIS